MILFIVEFLKMCEESALGCIPLFAPRHQQLDIMEIWHFDCRTSLSSALPFLSSLPDICTRFPVRRPLYPFLVSKTLSRSPVHPPSPQPPPSPPILPQPLPHLPRIAPPSPHPHHVLAAHHPSFPPQRRSPSSSTLLLPSKARIADNPTHHPVSTTASAPSLSCPPLTHLVILATVPSSRVVRLRLLAYYLVLTRFYRNARKGDANRGT